MNILKYVLASLILVPFLNDISAEPSVVFTKVLGPFTGDEAGLHPDNIAPDKIEYYGTDLGFSYAHKGQIHFLFGDTWAIEAYRPIERESGARLDDMYGTIDLDAVADPGLITPANMPLIKLGQNPGSTEVAAIDPGHAMDLGKTPEAGFSNGTDEFAIFFLGKPKGCMTNNDCDNGLVCENDLGYLGPTYSEEEGFTMSCLDGSAFCSTETMIDENNQAIKGSGFCSDQTSSIWAKTLEGQVSAAGLKQRVAVRSRTNPKKYTLIKDWITNKFYNTTVSTVESFVPENGPGYKNQNYNIASGTGKDRRVFLWGRPGFIGVAANHRTLGLYFAYVDIPVGPVFSWDLHYYTGNIDGIPQFSSKESDARPVDLDSTLPGIQAEEKYDLVNQMSVVWIDHLKKWVMFNGGGMIKLPRPPVFAKCGVLEAFARSECEDVNVRNGAIRMRTADDPWGPWSPQQDVIAGGDADVAGSGQYGLGGVLRHPACTSEGCAPHTDTQYYNKHEYGFFYSPNIIEQWIKPVGDSVDVIWNVSTWDPYRVVLLRTRIKP